MTHIHQIITNIINQERPDLELQNAPGFGAIINKELGTEHGYLLTNEHGTTYIHHQIHDPNSHIYNFHNSDPELLPTITELIKTIPTGCPPLNPLTDIA